MEISFATDIPIRSQTIQDGELNRRATRAFSVSCDDSCKWQHWMLFSDNSWLWIGWAGQTCMMFSLSRIAFECAWQYWMPFRNNLRLGIGWMGQTCVQCFLRLLFSLLWPCEFGCWLHWSCSEVYGAKMVGCKNSFQQQFEIVNWMDMQCFLWWVLWSTVLDALQQHFQILNSMDNQTYMQCFLQRL